VDRLWHLGIAGVLENGRMRWVGDHAGCRRNRGPHPKRKDNRLYFARVFFLVIVAIVSAGEGYFSHYQGIFGWGLFTVVAWAAMIAGVPFSLQYARDRALHELWKKPPSRQVHLRISLAWASIFTLNTFLAAIELIVGHRLLLVVIMPGTSMFLGFAFTILYPAFHRRQVVNRIETSDVASRVVLDCPLG
jgi:hypothetical protein